MRTAKHSGKFKRDYKRALGGKYRNIITHPKGELWAVIYALENGIPLPERYHDHQLHNNMEGFANVIYVLTSCYCTGMRVKICLCLKD